MRALVRLQAIGAGRPARGAKKLIYFFGNDTNLEELIKVTGKSAEQPAAVGHIPAPAPARGY
jgi:hypothetical protein